MEDNLNFLEIKGELNFLENQRQHQLFKMEDNINCLKWKTTSIFWWMEDDLQNKIKETMQF